MFIIPFSNARDSEILQLAVEKQRAAAEEWELHIWRFLVSWYSNSLKAIEVYSSGSTGNPKAIHHLKTAMATHAQITCKTLGLQPGVLAWLCLPANKIGGMMMLVRCAVNRMDLLCTKPVVCPFESLEENHAVALAALTPMQMKSTETSYNDYRKMNRIAKILLGGEAVSAGLIKHLRAAENSIYSTFGMTETISHIALKKLNGLSADSYYKTLQGVTISLDERHCLVVNAPAIGANHLVTNDIVELISETEFNWLGRIDNVINTGGIKVMPEAIEQKLLPFIDVPFFITGIPDDLTGEKVGLVLQIGILSEKERQKLSQHFEALNKYERPKVILLTPEFKVTESGKVKRQETLSLAMKRE